MLYELNLNAPKLDIIEMQYHTNALPCMIDVRRQINFK